MGLLALAVVISPDTGGFLLVFLLLHPTLIERTIFCAEKLQSSQYLILEYCFGCLLACTGFYCLCATSQTLF